MLYFQWSDLYQDYPRSDDDYVVDDDDHDDDDDDDRFMKTELIFLLHGSRE
jgi:hypothetical protein